MVEGNVGAEPLAAETGSLAGIRRVLERETLLIVALTAFLAWIASVAGYFVRQDTWLALVSGRVVAQHWLPHHDTLTVWTRGVRWIDQQWLAQLLLYWSARAGGLFLLLEITVLCLFVTILASTAAARALGASPARAALGAFMAVIAAPWETELRAQSFVLPLFVLVYWLLVTDARRPSRRVLLVLPVLALWANLHGSVTLAAGLVFLYGGLRLVQTARWRSRAPGAWLVPDSLVLCSPLMPFASPYGFALFHYYRLFMHPPLADFVVEWRPAWAIDWLPIPFYVLFFFTAVVLIVTRRRRLFVFEYLTLGLLGVGGFLAIRWIDWFGIAAGVSLPRLLTRPGTPRLEERPSRVRLAVAGAAVLAWPVLFLTVPDKSLVRTLYPDGGPEAVLAAVRSHPGARVFPDDSHADWLLWKEPALAGLVAYDVRFELTTREQLQRLVDYRARSGSSWKSAADGYRILVFDSRNERKLEQAILREPGARAIYRKGDFAVVLRARG